MSDTNDDLSKLLASTTLVLVGVALSSSTKLLELVIIGRVLSPTAYGDFNLALAVFTVGTTLGAAGFTQGVPRYIARFDTPVDIRGTWLTGLLFTTLVSLAIMTILLVGSPVVVPRLFSSDEALPLYLLFVIAIPLYVAFQVGVGAIRGNENTQYRILTSDICYPGLRLVLVGVLLLSGFGVVATGVSYLVASAVTALFAHVLLNRLVRLLGTFRLHVRKVALFSAPLIISSVMATLISRTDTLMLGYFSPSSEVGIYNAAYPLAGVLGIVLGAMGYMYLPIASRLDSNEQESIGQVYETTTKWVYLLVFPLFLTLFVYPGEIISTVFGREYVAGGIALQVLAIGFLTNVAVGRNRETLLALGESKFVMVSNALAFAFNFLLNLTLIPVYGFLGAAVASASSFVVLNVVIYAFLRRTYGMTPYNGRSARALLALPAVLLPLGLVVGELVPGSTLVVVVFAMTFTALTVGVAIAVGSLEPQDIVVVEFIEKRANVDIPVVRRFIPE